MEAVNLLPAYARPGRRWAAVGKDLEVKRVLMLGGIVAGAVAIGLGAAYAYERSVVNDKESQVNDATARLTAVNAQAAPIRTVAADASARLSAVQAVVNTRVPWENILAGLSRVLPSQVFLTSLSQTTPTPAAALAAGAAAPAGVAAPAIPGAAPVGFSISGSASSQVRVALILDRLAVLPWLSDVSLGSVTKAATGGDDFSVSATFQPTGG
jgi:Tfp pilus assembly protein PilN